MTTNSDREATASSCPDWLNDKAVADAVSGEFIPTDPWLVQQMAAEILRLRTALSRARIETQRTIDLIADPVEKRAAKVAIAARKAIETVLKCRELPAPPIDAVAEPFGLMGAVKSACEQFIRLRKENDVLRREEKRAGDTFSHIHRCLASVDDSRWTGQPPYDIASRVGTATAELLRLRKEAKRERADKAEAKLAEVARILGGNGDAVQRAKQSHARTEKLSSDLAKALAERNEFAAVREAMAAGSWCGTSRQEMPTLHFQFDPRKYAKDFAHRSITLATPVRTAQIPSTEALADIAYCRRDPTVQESRAMAGELLDRRRAVLPLRFDDGRVLSVGSIAGQAHPDAQPDGFPAELTLAMGELRCRYSRIDTAQRKAAQNQQRFSIGTDFYNALWRAKSAESDHAAVVAIVNALASMASAVEAELSRRP